MIQTTESVNGIKVSGLQTSQFKTLQFQCQFVTSLNDESAPKRALLAYLLKAASQAYPTRQKMTLHLQKQYGSHIRTGIRKVGETHVLTFFVSMINPEYTLNNENLLKSLFETLHGMIYQPLFDEAIFEEEKMAMIDYLLESASDPMKQAMIDLHELLYKNDVYQTRSLGRVDQYRSLTLDDIKATYQKMIMHDEVSVSWVGNIDSNTINPLIAEYLRQGKAHTPYSFISDPNTPAAHARLITKEKAVKQAKLLLAYRSNTTYKDPQYYAFLLFNTLLGGHSDSVLFNIIRTKHSMCYQIGSSYDPYKGSLIIYTGIDHSNVEQVIELINTIVSDIQKGHVEQEMLSLAQKAIETALISGLDSPFSMLNHLTKASFFNETWQIDEMIKHVNDVTLEDIVTVSNTLVKDITYLVKGGGQ
jgi:predicted Zn-dependent peptidase